MNVVVRSEDGAVSLLVDEIGDVLDVPAAHPGAGRRRPSRPRSRPMMLGSHKLEDELHHWCSTPARAILTWPTGRGEPSTAVLTRRDHEPPPKPALTLSPVGQECDPTQGHANLPGSWP